MPPAEQSQDISSKCAAGGIDGELTMYTNKDPQHLPRIQHDAVQVLSRNFKMKRGVFCKGQVHVLAKKATGGLEPSMNDLAAT